MATTSYSSNILKSKYRNWVKASLAVTITIEGITPFVCDEIAHFQQKCLSNICNNNGLPAGTTCSGCCTENVVVCPTNRVCNARRGQCRFHRNSATQYIPSGCPRKICHNFKNEIQKAHRFHCPSYRNTDATQWCSNPWEVAKCFMPPDGYKDVMSAEETGFNGILSVIINFKDFQSKVHADLNKGNNIFEEAREVAKAVRHSPNSEVEDTDLQHYFTVLHYLLSDPGYLALDTDAQNAKQKLSELQNDTLVIGKDLPDKIKNEMEELKKETGKQNLKQTEITKYSLKEEQRQFLVSEVERSAVDGLEKEKKKYELVREVQAETGKQLKVKASEGDTDDEVKRLTSEEEALHNIGEKLTTYDEGKFNKRKDEINATNTADPADISADIEDETEDERSANERRAIRTQLSKMPQPMVMDIESRSALIHLSVPEVSTNERDVDTEKLSYKLMLSRKDRRGKYKLVYMGEATEIQLKDLNPATEYDVKVSAMFNDIHGLPTEATSFKTKPSEPDQPQPPKLQQKTKTSLHLMWSPPKENGSDISSFVLESEDHGSTGIFEEVYNGPLKKYEVSELGMAKEYTFRLAAVNSIGISAFSEPVTFCTSGLSPLKPDPPMLAECLDTELLLSWIKRPNDNEFILEISDQFSDHEFSPVYSGPLTSHRIKNLERNKEYKFRLCALNDEGSKRWSDIVEYETLPAKPDTTSKTESQDFGNLPKEILRLDKDSVVLYKKALQEGKISVHNIRVMVVGHYDVGKTTLTKRLLGEPVDITKRESTNGIDVHINRCKISLKDGTWILQKSDKNSKALFHQLVNLFRKGNQKEETPLKHSEKINTVSESGDMPDEMMQEHTTVAEKHVSETGESAETGIVSGTETASGSDTPLQPRESDTTSQPREDDYEQSLQHLKKFIENVKTEDEHFGTSDLSLWDFAGQNVFYATHQVFFSRRAVYLLVTNMSKHITDTVDDDPWHNDCKGEKSCKVAEYLDFWLNSIHEFCSDPGESGPPVVLVGTFADKLTKESSTEDACSSLRKFLIEKAASCHLTTENFLLDNSVVDENIDTLRKHIISVASEQDYWGEDIPAKWVTLEDILAGIKEENVKVLPKDRLRELNMTLPSPIDTDEELELYLHFHHDMGNIIYFSEGDLANYILLDPQWLIDAFKSVITAESFCICRTNIQKEWIEFERTAVLKPGLIDTVWKKTENSDFYKNRNLLLTYMERLGLVARPIEEKNQLTKVEDWYFVPCMLKESPPKKVTNYCDSEHCKSTSKLCYTTDEEPEIRFFPTTVFNKMLAACLQRWPLLKQNKKSMIFCGGAVFSLKENHFLYIFFYEHVLQIWITRLSLDGQFPDPSVCTETKDILEYIIKSNIKMHSKIIPFVKCPRAGLYSNENMFLLEPSDDFSGPEKVCFCQENDHVILFDELTRYWSNDEELEDSSGIEKDANSRFTEMDFCKIATKIGKEYVQLGFTLGFSRAELDHIELDEKTTANKITAILGKWDQTMGVEATYCRLKRALIAIGKTAAEATSVLR